MSNTITLKQAKDKVATFAITQGNFNKKRTNTFKSIRSNRDNVQALLNHAMYFLVQDFNTAPLSALVQDTVGVNSLKTQDLFHWVWAATGGLSDDTLAIGGDSTLVQASPKDSILTWDKETSVFKIKKLPKDIKDRESANTARLDRLAMCAGRMAEVNYWELSKPQPEPRAYDCSRFIGAVRTAFKDDNFNGLNAQEKAMLNEVNEVLLKFGIDYSQPIKSKKESTDNTTKNADTPAVDKATKAKELPTTKTRARNRRTTSKTSEEKELLNLAL